MPDETLVPKDRLKAARTRLKSLSSYLTEQLEAFESEFPELKVSVIYMSRIDVSASDDPDKEIIHKVVIEAEMRA